MALVRVYCGLASADTTVGRAPASPGMTVAVVDDAGRLLGVHEVSDSPAGYAWLGTLLMERSAGLSSTAVAADSDDHVLTSLLTAAGRPLAVADDDSVDDFAERFADDDSPEEIQFPPAYRRAVGLARALQAGALRAVNLPTPRELASHKPILAAHTAMLAGRSAAATALREVLRELYPAALRAYPDPAQPLPMAVLDALPEPGMLTGAAHGRDAAEVADEVIAALVGAGVADQRSASDAVTALRVAIAESPRRGGVNKALSPAVADTLRAALSAMRACDAACASLIGTLTARIAEPPAAAPGRRSARRAAEAAPPANVQRVDLTSGGRRARQEPAPASGAPAQPRPMTTPPVAPEPVMPPPIAPRPVTPPPAAPAASTGLPRRSVSTPPTSRPVSAPPPPPPGISPIVPTPRSTVPPAEAGEPFRPTLTNAAINSARAERQRTVIPPRPVTRPQSGMPDDSPVSGGRATDYSLPMPAARPPRRDTPDPGSRANWPLVNPSPDDRVAPAPTSGAGRVPPPWQSDDLPAEPPALRLVDSEAGGRGAADESRFDRGLRLVDGEGGRNGRSGRRPNLTALDRGAAPPVPDEGDGDLLIFAAARSAWFTGHTDTNETGWESSMDSGWRAAEQAAQPQVGAETSAGLPRRVPQANLVPGSPLREERPLRIIRDAASIAAHTTGYFRGWRRGQEIGGYAIGGRPGREAAGGWDFSRDDGGRDDDYRSAGYPG